MSETRLLTLTEAAAATGLSVDAIRKRIKREQLWSVRSNEDGLVRVRLADGDLEKLKTFLKGQLPGYMVPNHFQQIEKVPLSPTGKADRKALPEPIL